MCCKVSAIFVLWLITFLGYTVQYMLLTNLNIAMTEMNEESQSHKSSTKKLNSSHPGNWTNDEHHFKERKQFSWNQSEEGLLLGAVFWLLWLSHPVGGTLSHKYGAKIVTAVSIFLTSCLCLIIPSATFIHMKLLLVARVVQGFTLGLAFPAILTVTQFWIPENKKGKFLTCFLGMSLGSGVTYFISGFIIDAFSWEGVFYVTGITGILWCGAWWYLMFDRPELHPRLTDEEKQAIRRKTKINFSVELARKSHVPWKQILTSGRVYISAFSQFGLLWIFFILIIYGPKFVKFFHDLNSIETGIVSGVPHFIRVIFSILYAAFTDKIIAKKIVSKTWARKIGTIVSHIIPGLALIMLAFNGAHFSIAVLSIYLSVVLTGAMTSGPVAGMADMSPNYAGVLLGLCGIMSHTAGFLNPLFVGYITLHNDTTEQWQFVFLISAGVAISSGLLFIIFWSSDLQEWDRPCSKVPDENFIYLKTSENNRTNFNDI